MKAVNDREARLINPLHNYRARATYVVDGDTVDLEFDLGFGVTFKDRMRLARIDAWEERGSEREMGMAATGFVRSLLHKDYTNAFPLLIAVKKDKDKWMGEIWLPDGTNLSDALVAEGHAEY